MTASNAAASAPVAAKAPAAAGPVPVPPGAAPRPVGGPPASPIPALAAFLGSNPDDRLRGLLGFALAVEEGKPVTPDAIEGLRRRADAELHAQAFRTLHNRVEEIRREAMEEQSARMRPPPRFHTLVLANLIACIAAGAVLVMLAPFFGGLG